MAGNGFTPNNNRQVIRMLSREFGKSNKGRNRILFGTVILCIVTLTMVFGISFGKVQAEFTKAVRAAGTASSVCVEDADQSQYGKVRSLGYVKQTGRCVTAGEAAAGGKYICKIQGLDDAAWETMRKPAYTDINGHYPEKKQEIMLPVRALKSLGIDHPKKGTKISLTVSIGLFRTEQEEFSLSGWYTDYVEGASDSAIGYISAVKLEDWGYNILEEADILICQSDQMDWQETEERLYQDLSGKESEAKITASNTYAYDAVNRLAGGYGMAAFGALIILSGMFFLIQNVMQISMAGDVRQMGLLNTIGTTKKQIHKIYFRQILRILIPGVLAGALLSAFVLLTVIPEILGNQYLSEYGGAKELRIFWPELLAAAVSFAVILTIGAAEGVIHHVVRISCVESVHYTGLAKSSPRQAKQRVQDAKHARGKHKRSRRSAAGELWYMAWQNLTRYRGRFLLTVLSLFLGIETFLGAVVITAGSDYVHVIEKRPDFLIAGEFSDWGKEDGYGSEYKSRDAGEDPMETEGESLYLLHGNSYDEFSPISSEVREKLLSLDGVERDKSYVMEGAYMVSTVSRKGLMPFLDKNDSFNEKAQVKEGVGYSDEYSMIEGGLEDVVQILSDDEISSLRRYVDNNNLPVDMDSLEDGTGVMILHDHQLSPKQEKLAEESVGEPMYFTTMRSKADWMIWNRLSPKERDTVINTEELAGKQSDTFTLSGYLDNRAEGFPYIRQTWHGAEGLVYYLISEDGFEKLPTEKKTLYMELNVDQKKEQEIKAEIQNTLSQENRRRKKMAGIGVDEETGETGIFCISKSDLLTEAENYIRGNRLILGSISAVLLFAGLTNYFNVMITGILSRKKELEVMESLGMTQRQKRRLLAAEGLYYCLIVAGLMLTAGSGILRLIRVYMEDKLSYFVFSYPVGWSIALIAGLAGICLVIPEVMYRRKNYGIRPICC